MVGVTVRADGIELIIARWGVEQDVAVILIPVVAEVVFVVAGIVGEFRQGQGQVLGRFLHGVGQRAEINARGARRQRLIRLRFKIGHRNHHGVEHLRAVLPKHFTVDVGVILVVVVDLIGQHIVRLGVYAVMHRQAAGQGVIEQLTGDNGGVLGGVVGPVGGQAAVLAVAEEINRALGLHGDIAQAL